MCIPDLLALQTSNNVRAHVVGWFCSAVCGVGGGRYFLTANWGVNVGTNGGRK